jgi:hypothetical protein
MAQAARTLFCAAGCAAMCAVGAVVVVVSVLGFVLMRFFGDYGLTTGGLRVRNETNYELTVVRVLPTTSETIEPTLVPGQSWDMYTVKCIPGRLEARSPDGTVVAVLTPDPNNCDGEEPWVITARPAQTAGHD